MCLFYTQPINVDMEKMIFISNKFIIEEGFHTLFVAGEARYFFFMRHSYSAKLFQTTLTVPFQHGHKNVPVSGRYHPLIEFSWQHHHLYKAVPENLTSARWFGCPLIPFNVQRRRFSASAAHRWLTWTDVRNVRWLLFKDVTLERLQRHQYGMTTSHIEASSKCRHPRPGKQFKHWFDTTASSLF